MLTVINTFQTKGKCRARPPHSSVLSRRQMLSERKTKKVRKSKEEIITTTSTLPDRVVILAASNMSKIVAKNYWPIMSPEATFTMSTMARPTESCP